LSAVALAEVDRLRKGRLSACCGPFTLAQPQPAKTDAPGDQLVISEEITMKLYRTTDLTEAAALWSHGYPLHRIEIANGWATFVIGYVADQEAFEKLVNDYQRGQLLVEAGEFARRRNETAAKMRRALDEAVGDKNEGQDASTNGWPSKE